MKELKKIKILPSNDIEVTYKEKKIYTTTTIDESNLEAIKKKAKENLIDLTETIEVPIKNMVIATTSVMMGLAAGYQFMINNHNDFAYIGLPAALIGLSAVTISTVKKEKQKKKKIYLTMRTLEILEEYEASKCPAGEQQKFASNQYIKMKTKF